MREEGGDEDTNNFSGATHFFRRFSDLSANGRRVVLILIGYRCHMSLSPVEMLHANNVIV